LIPLEHWRCPYKSLTSAPDPQYIAPRVGGFIMPNENVFTPGFLANLRILVGQHHVLYRQIPPQGIYFEALVEEAFNVSKIPFTRIQTTARNVPRHDLSVEGAKISIKTETGEGTNRNYISITKLCTTEKDPWEAQSLINHAVQHLSRYDYILMLRAVWERPVIHYQVLDIPINLLRMIEGAQLEYTGRRTTRKSMTSDIFREGRKVFQVYFDAADGKCQIKRLPVAECQILTSWDYQMRD